MTIVPGSQCAKLLFYSYLQQHKKLTYSCRKQKQSHYILLTPSVFKVMTQYTNVILKNIFFPGKHIEYFWD